MLTTARESVVIAGTGAPLEPREVGIPSDHTHQGSGGGGSVIDRLADVQDSDPWAIPRAPTDGETVVLLSLIHI